MARTSVTPDGALPLVSIVLPTHRPNPYFGAALESVRAQTWARWELVVVDDGWSDRSLLERLVGDDPRCRIVFHPPGGVARARNRGLSEAAGTFIAFLDHDDEWMPDHLTTTVEALQADAGAVASYSLGRTVDTKGVEILHLSPRGPVTNQEILSGGDRPSINTLLARRDAVLRVGGFEYLVEPADDLDLIFKLALEGHFACTGTASILYRIHEGGLSQDLVAICDAHLRMLQLHEKAARARNDAPAAALFRKNRRYQEDCYSSLARRELVHALRADTRDQAEITRIVRWYARLPVRSLVHDVVQGAAAKARQVLVPGGTRPRDPGTP